MQIGPWTPEKFLFKVRKREKEVRAKRDFFPSSWQPSSFHNLSLDMSISSIRGSFYAQIAEVSSPPSIFSKINPKCIILVKNQSINLVGEPLSLRHAMNEC